jgi:hypothetical protein
MRSFVNIVKFKATIVDLFFLAGFLAQFISLFLSMAERKREKINCARSSIKKNRPSMFINKFSLITDLITEF